MNFHQDCLSYILVIIDLRNMNRKGWIWSSALNNNYHSLHLRMGNTCYVSRRMTWSIPFLQTYVGAEHPTRPSRDPTDTIFWKRRRIKIFLEQVKLVLPLSRPGCWRPWSKDKRLGEWRSQTPCKLLAPEHQIGMICLLFINLIWWRDMVLRWQTELLSNLNNKLIVDVVPRQFIHCIEPGITELLDKSISNKFMSFLILGSLDILTDGLLITTCYVPFKLDETSSGHRS